VQSGKRPDIQDFHGGISKNFHKMPEGQHTHTQASKEKICFILG
jgi:hypothetical protein